MNTHYYIIWAECQKCYILQLLVHCLDVSALIPVLRTTCNIELQHNIVTNLPHCKHQEYNNLHISKT